MEVILFSVMFMIFVAFVFLYQYSEAGIEARANSPIKLQEFLASLRNNQVRMDLGGIIESHLKRQHMVQARKQEIQTILRESLKNPEIRAEILQIIREEEQNNPS